MKTFGKNVSDILWLMVRIFYPCWMSSGPWTQIPTCDCCFVPAVRILRFSFSLFFPLSFYFYMDKVLQPSPFFIFSFCIAKVWDIEKPNYVIRLPLFWGEILEDHYPVHSSPIYLQECYGRLVKVKVNHIHCSLGFLGASRIIRLVMHDLHLINSLWLFLVSFVFHVSVQSVQKDLLCNLSRK